MDRIQCCSDGCTRLAIRESCFCKDHTWAFYNQVSYELSLELTRRGR